MRKFYFAGWAGFFLLLAGIVFAPFGSNTIELGTAMEIDALASLQLTGFSVAPTSPAAGENVNFYLTVYSVGNVVTTFSAVVDIYNSAGSLVESISFVNSTISGGEEQTLVKSWSTAGLPVGNYTAYVNVSYDGNWTGPKSASFFIVQPSGGGGGSGSYQPSPGIKIPIYPSPPKVEVPAVGPIIENLHLLRLSPYMEMLPGESAIISPLLENPTDSLILLNISMGGGGEWLSSPVQNVLLAPREKRSVPISIKIPSNMPRGYYAFYVKVSSGDSEISYPAVIRVVQSYSLGEPVAKRHISLDYEKNQTLVGITVTNTGGSPLSYLQVYDRVPDQFMYYADSIDFTTKPAKISGDEKFGVKVALMRWDVDRLMPYESRTIYYRMPLILNDVSTYSRWNLAQLNMIKGATPTDIEIRDLRSPSMLPGERGEITLKLFNSGSSSREVEIDVLSPSGWRVLPTSMTVSIPSRESQTLSIGVISPKFASAGTYGFTIRIKHEESIFDKQVFVYLYTPLVEVYAPPITDQLSAWLGSNFFYILAGALAILLAAAGLAVAYRYWQLPKYSRERIGSLKMMERMFEQPMPKRKRRLDAE
ncbi:MAG: NEW3 domain-containing protein [Candidatus Micrarchaeota archaeon]|nr:NEW3 domain-containing protein [Candidatus Micrarchaeota archaeon]